MRKNFIVFGLLLAFTASAQVDVKSIDNYIEKARKAWNVPGMAVAIVKDGNVVLSKGYGVKKTGAKDKVDENTQFAIASNTKAFLSSAIAKLVSEGKLSWKDKVRDHLPYFSLYGEFESAETTVEDLLCHRVGLGTFSGDVIWYKSQKSAEEVIKRASHVPQAYGFRDGYGYTNLMFITAGEVVRAVTGMSWAEYVNVSFILPLGMNNTVSSVTNLSQNTATPHKPTLEDGTIPIEWTNWDNMGAAGGIISSVDDMAKWMMMNLSNGVWEGDTLLDPVQQNLLWTPHNNYTLSASSKEFIPGRHFASYGLGWSLMDYYGTMAVSHGGGYDGMYSRVMMIPDLNLGVVVLTNSMEGISTPIAYYVVNQYLKQDQRDWSAEFLERSRANNGHRDDVEERMESRVSNTSPTKSMAEHKGEYYDPMYGVITVSDSNGQLRIEFADAPELGATLEHWHYDTYQLVWDEEHAWFDFGTVSFELDNNLVVQGLSFDVPNGDIFFHELNPKRKD